MEDDHACGAPGTTTFDDVLRDIVAPGGARAERELALWRSRRLDGPLQEAVHAFVTGHGHSVLNRLGVADVRAATEWDYGDPALRLERHALGERRADDTKIKAVEDWTTPWALSFVFHDLLERLGHVPTWPEMRAFINGGGRAMLKEPFDRAFAPAWTLGQGRGYDLARKERHYAAFRFRVGKAYYSALREIDAFVRLRRIFGLPLRYHVLADVLFRTDFWCGRALVDLMVPNAAYRDGGRGRKRQSGEFMDQDGFGRLVIPIEVPRSWGRPDLVPRRELERVAARMRQMAAAA